jgi:potassium-transporting ATPase potassium-binding subunit
MTLQGWAEILTAIGLALALAWPIGAHIGRVWSGEPTWLDPVLQPVERGFHRLAGVDPDRGQSWFEYALSMLAFHAAGFFALYALLRLQAHLPLNPEGAAGMSPDLAFNAAIAFITNTDWQSYVSEREASHFTQMAGLTTQNFVSAGSGMAIAAAFARAFASRGRTVIGNFWADMVRNTLYVLAPLSIVVALALAATGVPQTLLGRVEAHTVEGHSQTIALGPVASQEAVKQVGTNGGGFFNANSAHPFENPTSISNMIEMVAMITVGFACGVAFGRVTGSPGDARILILVMAAVVLAAAGAVYAAETQPTPALVAAHVTPTPNMEGKEVRFGAAGSAGFVALTAGSSAGAVNSMHESLTPAGGGVALFLILLGEHLPGGDGWGLTGMLVMALLAIFLAGQLVGRTPEYLGKKIETREIKLAMLASLILSALILGFSAVTAFLPQALEAVSASGPHGLTEFFYTYASAAANNGSSFSGLRANSPYWNVTLGVIMALGRFGIAIPVLAIAGSVAAKPKLAPTMGTFPTDSPLFAGLVAAVILIITGLQYFPALALGPINEQILMMRYDSRQTTASAPATVRTPPGREAQPR